MAFSKRLPVIAWLAFLLLVAFPVHAEPTLAEMDEARAFLKEGREQLKAQHFDRAATLLEKAHRIMHVPPTGLDLMQAYDGLDKLVEAWGIGEEIQKLPVKPKDPPAFAAAREQINMAMEGLATRIPTIRLRTAGNSVLEADATIDGVSVSPEQLDKQIRVNPGAHKVRVTAPHCEPFETTQETEAGAERHYEVEVKLVCKPPPPVVLQPQSSPSGMTDDAARLRTNWIIVGSFIGGSVALAGAGMAIGSEIANEQAVLVASRKDCIDTDACERIYDREYGASKSWAIASIVGLGLGAGVGVATLFYALRSGSSSEAPVKPRVSLQVIPSGHGMALRGTW